MKKPGRMICTAIYCTVICMVFTLSMFTRVYAKVSGNTIKSLETMTDEYMVKVLSDYHVCGAAVSVVKDGNLLFQKGYGYSDLKNKVSVNAETTSFQIASVSKVFTATAVMQMVEQGNLSLDQDVNRYLTAFKINNPYSKPVTLRTLLTHTSGLDFRVPLFIPSSGNLFFNSLDSLEHNLKENLPPVVREPGTFCQYNGYGIALAGYLVEIASGEPLDQYIADNILGPLGMKHSSYSLTKSVFPYMSKPYINLFGHYFKRNFTLMGDHPAGSICASASDMANFMLAHLNGGEFNGKRILNPDTAIKMHTHEYPEDERLTGFSLGFYEAVRNGYKTLEFGGHLPCYSSKLSLLLERNIGIFIAINTDSTDSQRVCNEYIDMVYKNLAVSNFEEASGTIPVPFDMGADAISGRYSFSEYGETDFSKVKSVMLTCKVKCDNKGNLNFSSSGLKWKFRYIGSGMFYCKDNGYYCRLFEIGGKRVINILGFDYFKINKGIWLIFIISLISQPVLAVCILVLFILLIKNRKRDKGLYRTVKIVLMINAALVIFYSLINALTSILYMTGDTSLIFSTIQPAVPIICWSSVGITIASMFLTGFTWLRNKAGLKGKIALSILTVLFIPNIIIMYLMNAMKFNI